MKRNEKFYTAHIKSDDGHAYFNISTYSLGNQKASYFADIKLRISTIQFSDVTIPSNRQASDKEELIVTGSTSTFIDSGRENEIQFLENKLKEIFGESIIVLIEEMPK
jgi:hypothetical protein